MAWSRSTSLWLIALLVWLGLLAGGSAWLLRYTFAVGKATVAPHVIPSLLSPGASLRPQLFLALHPQCPCSRATVRELAKILRLVPGRTDVTVLAFAPVDAPEEWLEGRLIAECRKLNCQIRPDPAGRLAASLGSLTSGRVVLYDKNGRLRYQGGITGSRGHEGDNAGEQAVIEILSGCRESHKSMPVFGCPIRSEPSGVSSL
jgi:hypothetical protein